MSAEPPALWTWRVDELRRAFDASFAMPAQPPATAVQRILLLTVGGTPCGVRIAECAGVVPAGVIVGLPSATRGFRGLTTVRGAVVPVYDLATRLDLEPRPVAQPWLLLAAGAHPVAFLVDRVDGYASVDDAVAAAPDGLKILTIEGTARRLVALGHLVTSIGAEHA